MTGVCGRDAGLQRSLIILVFRILTSLESSFHLYMEKLCSIGFLFKAKKLPLVVLCYYPMLIGSCCFPGKMF